MKLKTKIILLLILILAFLYFLPQNLTEKTVYITVDSEGNETEINNIFMTLEKNNISATFFVVGKTAETYPGLFREISEKNSVQCHTYSHVNLKKLSYEEQKKEIEKSQEAVFKATGRNCTYFRPPFMKKNKNTEKILQEYKFLIFNDLNPIQSVFLSDYLIFKLKIPAKIYWKIISVLSHLKSETIVIIHPQITGSSEKNLNPFDEYISKLKEKNANFKIIK